MPKAPEKGRAVEKTRMAKDSSAMKDIQEKGRALEKTALEMDALWGEQQENHASV
jgi:hypothetical protein